MREGIGLFAIFPWARIEVDLDNNVVVPGGGLPRSGAPLWPRKHRALELVLRKNWYRPIQLPRTIVYCVFYRGIEL